MKYGGPFLLLASFLCSLHAQSRPRVDFNEAPTYQLPTNPFDVAAGDFNGDGKPDLAVATGGSLGGGGVLILLNDGNGWFGAPTFFAAADGVSHIAVADLNGDKKLDLACADSSGISVFIGQGDGRFRLTATNRTDAYTRWIAVSDFNGDGAPDLATTSSETNLLSVFLSDRAEKFFPSKKFYVGALPWGIAAGDFNRDGKLDLVTANWGGASTNSISLLTGLGTGDFSTPVLINLGMSPVVVSVADLDRDGKTDLLLCDGRMVTALLGSGTGTFRVVSQTAIVSGMAHDMEVADINGDGHPDVIAVTDGNAANVLVGNGDGTFAAASYGVGNSPDGLTLGDFNGDGRQDVVVANFFGSLSLLFQKSDGTFGAPVHQLVEGYWASFLLADFNGDQRLDILAGTGTMLSSRFGDGYGGFVVATNILGDFGPEMLMADLDGDGYKDLVSFNSSRRGHVLRGLRGGGFKMIGDVAFTNQPFKGAIGDFNNDGKPDLGIIGFPASLTIMLGNGDGSFSRSVVQSLGRLPMSLDKGDFNGDGKLDLAIGNYDGTLDVFLGGGGGIFDFTYRYDLGSDLLKALTAADFDGDGILDLVALVKHDDSAVTLLGNGDGTFTISGRYYTVSGPSAVAVGDINGDGFLDLVPVGYGFAHLLLGKGDGTFNDAGRFSVCESTEGVALGDINGDGELDLVISGRNSFEALLNQSNVRLDIERAEGSIKISWPGFTAGLRLEATTDISSINGWSSVWPQVLVGGRCYTVTNSLVSARRFFRLRKSVNTE
jgi:hypothetical protein